MLKFIRRNADAPWVKFIFVAIVAVFIFWGMGGIVGGEKNTVVARVNNEAIDPTDFDRAYDSLLRLYQDIYKDNFKPEMLRMLDLKGKALDQLIHVTLLQQEAEHIGLRVGETELRDSIATLPNFQTNGLFNKDLYVRALRANNISPGEFEDAQRQELLVKKMQDLITSGVHVSEAEVHDRYVFDNEKVTLRFVKLDATAFTSEVQLTDADVQAFFDKNKETFREPDRVRIEYVLYPPEHFAEKAEVSDADIQRYYDGHQADYQKPEQVHARHILVKVAPDADDDAKAAARAKAEAALAKVKAGEDFATLAQQLSEDGSAPQGGDLGFFPRGKMVKPFEDAAFALAPGSVSEIVESPFGLHIIKVEAKEDARTQTIEEVRNQIVTTLKLEKARELARTQADADHAKAAAGESLGTLAQAAGLTVSAPAPFAQNEAIPNLGRNPDLAKAAFATANGQVGPLLDTPKGVFVFRLVEKIDSHVPELAEIRERVDGKVRTEKAEAVAKTKADALRAEVAKSDIATAAAAGKLKVEETAAFTRAGTNVPSVGNAPDLKKDAFQLTPDKPLAPAVYNVSGSSVIAVLKERLPADEEKFKSDKDNLVRQAEDRRRGQAMEEFINYLKARATIWTNQEFIASVSDTGKPLDGGRRRRR